MNWWIVGGILVAYAFIGLIVGTFALAWSQPERTPFGPPPPIEKTDRQIAVAFGVLWPIALCIFVWILLPKRNTKS